MSKYSSGLFAILLLMVACHKEAAIVPSNPEDVILTVKDNPSDPTDHAIYQFFQNTGIPCFYNDTLNSSRTVINGVLRNNYTILKMNWSPATGKDTLVQYRLPANKVSIIPMLNLVKEELLPLVPPSIPFRSILFVDTLFSYADIRLPDTDPRVPKAAYAGFSGLVLPIVDPDTMNEASRKAWAGHALAALCFRKITQLSDIDLYKDFYSISRTAFQNDIYLTEFTSWFPDGSKAPEDFGITYYYRFYEFIIICSEQEDLQAFLSELFSHSRAELNNRYAAYPVVLQKLEVLRGIASNAGFKLPE